MNKTIGENKPTRITHVSHQKSFPEKSPGFSIARCKDIEGTCIRVNIRPVFKCICFIYFLVGWQAI